MKGFVIIHSFKDGKAMSDDRIEYANGDYVLLSDYDKVVDELISEKSYITQLKHDSEEMKRKHEDEIEKIKENVMSVIRYYIKHYRDPNDMKMRIAELESELESKGSEIERLKKRIGKLASIRVRCHESARDSFDLGNYGCLHIVTADELKTTKDNIQKINLNETIKVKLTPYGAEIYYKQFDELNKQCGREICKPHMPRIDKDGYTEFQLWHFIELYGQHIGMCKLNVIEPLDIVYCGNDKCHSNRAE